MLYVRMYSMHDMSIKSLYVATLAILMKYQFMLMDPVKDTRCRLRQDLLRASELRFGFRVSFFLPSPESHSPKVGN